MSPTCTRNYLVSDGTSSSTMPPTGMGSGKDFAAYGDELGKWLERLEELVRSKSSNLCDVKQQ
jgi:hypothetical protein